jgi:hypothetical protein
VSRQQSGVFAKEDDAMARCPACRGDLDPKATVCPHCGYNFVAEREKRPAVLAMIRLAEGKPAVHVDGHDGSVCVCRRLSDLRLALDECTLYGWCDWVDPPEARPGELSDGLAISYPDCLQLGPGWFVDGYFNWYMVYEPSLVARSLAGDHSWVPAFLKSAAPPKPEPIYGH